MQEISIRRRMRSLSGTLDGYLRADMDSASPVSRRGKDFSSYIVCEFLDEVEGSRFVTGIIFDCRSDGDRKDHFFIYDGSIPDDCFLVEQEAMDTPSLRVCLKQQYGARAKLYDTQQKYRRDMLRVEKKELPEYKFQEASVRDAFNQAIKELEQKGLVCAEWVNGRPVLSAVVLNLDRIVQCYQAVGRVHPKERAETVLHMVQDTLDHIEEPWIAAWREDVCANAKNIYTVPHYCKKDTAFLSQLLTALKSYDLLRGDSITMRAFSSKCCQNSKLFEREIRDVFLHIAEKYHPGLAELCEYESLGTRDKLAYLGIYARPELCELSGKCALVITMEVIDVGASYPYGIALPSTAVSSIARIELSGIQKIVFIENKTNYDEYLLSELEPSTLAVYHGGFQMFSHLKELVPSLQPMKMAFGISK